MVSIIRCFQAERIKCRHTPFLAVHLLFPVLGAAVFAGYFRIYVWDKLTDIAAFLETAAIAHPFLIGIISGIAVQMENTAGHFQILLGTIPSRSGAYIGKCCYLIMWCAISTALGILLFAIFYPAVLPVFYIKPFIMLTLSAIPLYLISLNAGLFLGKTGAMGIGIAGSLLTALCATGLGDFVWKFLPWGWGIRFAEYCVLEWVSPERFNRAFHELETGLFIMMFFTLLLFIGSLWWFKRWEGTKENE